MLYSWTEESQSRPSLICGIDIAIDELHESKYRVSAMSNYLPTQDTGGLNTTYSLTDTMCLTTLPALLGVGF